MKKWRLLLWACSASLLVLLVAGFIWMKFFFNLAGVSERYDEEVNESVGWGREVIIPKSAKNRYNAAWGFEDSTRVICFQTSKDEVRKFAEAYAGMAVEDFQPYDSTDLSYHPARSLGLLDRWVKNARGYWNPALIKKGWYASDFADSAGWEMLIDLESGWVFLVEFTT